MQLTWKSLALLSAVTLMFRAVDCSAEPLGVRVTDDRGSPVKDATVRGAIELENGNYEYFSNTTDENGFTEIECGEGVRVSIWVEKYGWWQNAYPNNGPEGIPEAIIPSSCREISVTLTKKNKAQLY